MIFMSPITGIAQDKPITTTYDPADQADIEVLVGDAWRPGQFRNWVERGGEQWASVEYGLGSGGRRGNRIAMVPLPRLRRPVRAV